MSSENNQTVVRLDKVNRLFQTDKVDTYALADVNLTINKGEYVAITGPSGSGKSTLMAILGLLDVPSNGQYWINGTPSSALSASQMAEVRNREIGFIFQDFNLIGDLTVYENVELPLTYRDMSRSERKERVERCLTQVGMMPRAEHYPSQLSGGQQQRVAVARSVVGTPSLLLADEPTGNLDSVNGEAVMKLLSNLNQDGVTVCMVTHDVRYAQAAKRVVKLFDGRISEDNTAKVQAS